MKNLIITISILVVSLTLLAFQSDMHRYTGEYNRLDTVGKEFSSFLANHYSKPEYKLGKFDLEKEKLSDERILAAFDQITNENQYWKGGYGVTYDRYSYVDNHTLQKDCYQFTKNYTTGAVTSPKQIGTTETFDTSGKPLREKYPRVEVNVQGVRPDFTLSFLRSAENAEGNKNAKRTVGSKSLEAVGGEKQENFNHKGYENQPVSENYFTAKVVVEDEALTGVPEGTIVDVQAITDGVLASGEKTTAEDYTYGWYVNGKPYSSVTGKDLAVVVKENTVIYCKVTLGQKTLETNTIEIKLRPTKIEEVDIGEDRAVVMGEQVTLTGRVSKGSLPITYQWFYQGQPIQNGLSASYSFMGDISTPEMKFRCEASNAAGTVSSKEITITVVNDDKAVLFNDGSLYLSCPQGKLDGWEKEGVHGGIKKIYPAITQANPYRFANEAEQPWSEEREEILRVDSWNEIFPEDMSYWFKNCENLKELEGDKIRCTNLTKMVSTFENAGSKAENLVYRFYHGSASSPWETGKVKEMTDAFKRCGYGAKELRLMGIGQWDVSGTEQFEGMFDQCGYKVKAFQLDLSRWNTQNAVTFDHMFKNAGAYSERFDLGDLSHWNTKTVTSLNSMFAFSGGKAKTWSAGDFSGWNTGAVTDLRYMFGAAAEQADVQFDLSAWDVSKVTTMDSTFSHLGTEAKNWSIGDLSQWNVGAVESFTSTFYFLGKNAEQISLGNLKDWDLSSATDTSGMFYRFGENAKTTFIGDLSAWNVSNVRRMDHMFHSFAYGNTGVVDIGKLNRWNTEKVISMSNMFNEAGSHGKLFDIGRFRIGKNVSNTENLFKNAWSLSGTVIFDGLPVQYANCFLATSITPGAVTLVTPTENTAGKIWGIFSVINTKVSSEAKVLFKEDILETLGYAPSYKQGVMKETTSFYLDPSWYSAKGGSFDAGDTFMVYRKMRTLGGWWYQVTTGGNWAYIPERYMEINEER